MVVVLEGQYLEEFVKDTPGELELLLDLIVAIQVYRTGKPAVAWRHRMRAPILGSSRALRSVGAAVHLVGMDK